MKVFLMITFFMFFSFLGAEEPQTPAQDQNNKVEATAETQVAAPAETQVAAPAETQVAAPAEVAAQPAVEEPKAQEPAKEVVQVSENNDEQGYNLKLRALEEKVNSLKDKIFKSKQRLAVLQETVLGGTVGGSIVTINHKNDTGSLFKLVSAVYYLDDKPIFNKIDLPAELGEKDFQVYDAVIAPGPHRISVKYVFIGKGHGFFSYMKDYSINISADHSFIIEDGDIVEVEVSAFDKGSMHNFDNRIGLSFSVNKNMLENRELSQEE